MNSVPSPWRPWVESDPERGQPSRLGAWSPPPRVRARPGHLGHASPEGLPSEYARSVHRATVILGPPAGAVDVYVLRLQAEGLCLHDVRDGSVQHAHACAGGRGPCTSARAGCPSRPPPRRHLSVALSLGPGTAQWWEREGGGSSVLPLVKLILASPGLHPWYLQSWH